MTVFAAERVAPLGERLEQPRYGRVINRLVRFVEFQILLADIGDVLTVRIFGEKMVEGLVARRAHVLGNGGIPFLAVVEDGIDVEDHPRKGNSRCRTTSPIAKRATDTGGMSGSGTVDRLEREGSMNSI